MSDKSFSTPAKGGPRIGFFGLIYEKLDFALRNDPTLLDDVGLVVLDEGHMIGADERGLEAHGEAPPQR